MTLRLGFVGVGKWARKLAESFRACGAEVVAYDRENVRRNFAYGPSEWARCNHEPLPGFGYYEPWRDQLADKSIDAIVAVAPPEVTTEVAMACAAAGKPVMATKPLFDHPATIRSVFYVDFWRLWGESYQLSKGMLAGTSYERELVLEGSGPIRDFPGAFDYGPHVMAALLDMAREGVALVDAKRLPSETGELFAATYEVNMGHLLGRRTVHVRLGNGATSGVRSFDHVHETPTHIGAEPRERVMRNFCQAFINDVHEGHVDPKLLNYSREGMRMLRQLREVAE